MRALLRGDGPPLRIGHKGAAALAPENTLRSLARAIELGVDLVEFDVLEVADRTLVVAHSDDLYEVSHGAARGSVCTQTLTALRGSCPELPTLDEAVELLAAAGVGVHVDLKGEGYERGVLATLRQHGVVGRSLVSSCYRDSLRALAGEEPSLALGLTYPFDRFRASSRRLLAPAVRGSLIALRRLLPHRIAGMLQAAQASVAVLQYLVVSPALVARCHALGVPVVAWTIDDRETLAHLAAAGVDAVVTNDPRIFQG